HLFRKCREAPKGPVRAFDSGGRQPSRLGDTGTEPRQDLLVDKRRRRAREALVDDESNGVRPDVDYADRPQPGDAPLRGRRLSRAGAARRHAGRRISATARGPKGWDWS